jgi:hypothetical protein
MRRARADIDKRWNGVLDKYEVKNKSLYASIPPGKGILCAAELVPLCREYYDLADCTRGEFSNLPLKMNALVRSI